MQELAKTTGSSKIAKVQGNKGRKTVESSRVLQEFLRRKRDLIDLIRETEEQGTLRRLLLEKVMGMADQITLARNQGIDWYSLLHTVFSFLLVVKDAADVSPEMKVKIGSMIASMVDVVEANTLERHQSTHAA